MWVLWFVDILRFSAGSFSPGPRRAAGRGRAQTAARAGTTIVSSTRGGKRCVTVTPTVRKQETAARTTNACAKSQVRALGPLRASKRDLISHFKGSTSMNSCKVRRQMTGVTGLALVWLLAGW